MTGEQTHVSRDLETPTPYHPHHRCILTPLLALIVAIIMGHSQVSSIYKTLDRKLSCTKLLLFSYLHPDLAMYLTGRILYIDDATVKMQQAPFAQEELKAVSDMADTLVPLTISKTPLYGSNDGSDVVPQWFNMEKGLA
ncbi:hypothetical protein [Corynebacterium sp. MSK204]|uniref:hypothetical protein n=1 Tax=Corynebacterium sp. MSK204 TaxID=3050217 RepID=UPI00254B59B8|nr:hypothetical protein [Corynebacterium sp. MSK204]MDK8658921.1 hypothetical protein [Corynebacterium sp. MSK204]